MLDDIKLQLIIRTISPKSTHTVTLEVYAVCLIMLF